ncbi:CapA family protein [Halovenus rubra]|uniref:CapA family protein n=2 Tax=Halovenus rubra TaxID=869890 RepID=A0ACC7DY95_9EURY|nr:CapA family protein [Halovenus rubra]
MRTRRSVLATGFAGLAGCSGIISRSHTSRETVECLNAGAASARIGFVGDVMLGRSVNERWTGGDPAGVWGSTLSQVEELDGLVLNLECCIAEDGDRWPGKTYYFRADPSFAIPALERAGASVVSLANNHTLDFGSTALRETQAHLDGAEIAYTGAGKKRNTAVEPAVFESSGLTVATFALTDQYQEYAAGKSEAGTAFVELSNSIPSTRRLVQDIISRTQSHDPDLIVASLHWGPNWETEPDKTQEGFARWLVEQGVDVVHGHSAHVLQGLEVYQGRPIIYDAGDFVDDYVDYVDRQGVRNKRSAMFELVVTDGTLDELRVVPIHIKDETATLATGAIADWVHDTIAERSAPYDVQVKRDGDVLSVPLGEC